MSKEIHTSSLELFYYAFSAIIKSKNIKKRNPIALTMGSFLLIHFDTIFI